MKDEIIRLVNTMDESQVRVVLIFLQSYLS